MKFLKTKYYLYKTTGKGTGIVREKPFDTQKDANRALRVNKFAYQGWSSRRGSGLIAMTAGNRIVLEVI